MIYLASPYSNKDPGVMEARYIRAVQACGHFMKHNEVIYSPIVHNHPIAHHCELPRGWDFWRRFDVHMLRQADRFYILLLDGWMDSKGIEEEAKTARSLYIPVFYVNPSTYEVRSA